MLRFTNAEGVAIHVPRSVLSRGLAGLDAPLVTVEVRAGNGLPGVNLVGPPEAEVREARDRVRAALQNAQFDFPPRNIVVVSKDQTNVRWRGKSMESHSLRSRTQTALISPISMKREGRSESLDATWRRTLLGHTPSVLRQFALPSAVV